MNKYSVLVALVPLLALASCDEVVDVRIKETGTDTVFHFGITGLLSNDLRPICLRMIEVINTKTEEQVWKTVRKDNKCNLINSAALGGKIPGFVERINDLPLRKGQSYVVSIIADEGAISDKWNYGDSELL